MKKILWIMVPFTLLYSAQYEDNIRLCDEGNMVACFNMGVMHMSGIRGAVQDEKKAFEYFSMACNGGDIDGCINAGKYYEDGKEIKQDYLKAVDFYTKACDGREAYACMILGNFYRDGKGVIESDSTKAANYYKKVCELGYSEGCKEFEMLKK